MPTQRSQPRAMQRLMVVVVMNSVFGLLWPVFVPTITLIGSHLFANTRPVVIIMVFCILSSINLVVISGLWMRQQWAFRLGLTITVFTLASEILIILVSISQTIFDFAALLALILTSVVLSFFLQPDVIRTVIEWKQRG